MNICAVVISYFPEGDFFSRVMRIRPQVKHLLIVDNSSSRDTEDTLTMFESQTDVHIIRNATNLGIAAALNQGMQWAENAGCQWIITLDQDTVPMEHMVSALCAVYQSLPDKATLAVIGSNYIDPNTRRPFRTCESENHWVEVKTAITSGSLISLSAARKTGPFREELFIDCVDFEYCLRARSMGFHVIMTCEPLMEHGIGNFTEHNLPWKTTGTSNHSALRRYYMTRNQLVLAREYFWKEPVWTMSTLYRHLKDTILLCLFEEDVFHKLKNTVVGMWDGVSGKFSRKPA